MTLKMITDVGQVHASDPDLAREVLYRRLSSLLVALQQEPEKPRGGLAHERS